MNRKCRGHCCRICGSRKPNEAFSGKGHRDHICKACSRMPKEEREAIEQLGEAASAWGGPWPRIWSAICVRRPAGRSRPGWATATSAVSRRPVVVCRPSGEASFRQGLDSASRITITVITRNGDPVCDGPRLRWRRKMTACRGPLVFWQDYCDVSSTWGLPDHEVALPAVGEGEGDRGRGQRAHSRTTRAAKYGSISMKS